MKYLLPILTVFVGMLAEYANAQVSSWKNHEDVVPKGAMLAPNGQWLVYITDADSIRINCVDIATGVKRWVKNSDIYRNGFCQFVNSETLLVCRDSHFEFIDAHSGHVLGKVPAVADVLGNVQSIVINRRSPDQSLYYRESNMMFVLFDNGIQAIDMLRMETVYASSLSRSGNWMRRSRYGDVICFETWLEEDSIYFFDLKQNRFIVALQNDQYALNRYLDQNIYAFDSVLIVMTSDSIALFNGNSGGHVGWLPVDPDEVDNCYGCLLNNEVCVFVSHNGTQTLYNAATMVKTWEILPGEIPGVVDELYQISDDGFLMVSYETRGYATAYRVDRVSGRIVWSLKLFGIEGEFLAGYRALGAKRLDRLPRHAFHGILQVGSYAFAHQRIVPSFLSSDPPKYGIPYSEVGWAPAAHRDMRFPSNVDRRFWQLIQRPRISDGYAVPIFINGDRVAFVCCGLMFLPDSSNPRRLYDGERIVVVDMDSGSIVSQFPINILRDRERSYFNACTAAPIADFDSATVIYGLNDIIVFRKDTIERFSFDNLTLTYIDRSDTALIVLASDNEERNEYWCISVAGGRTRRFLLARSTLPNVVFHEGVSVNATLLLEHDSMFIFPLVEVVDDNLHFERALKSLALLSSDSLYLPELDEVDGYYSRARGVAIYGRDVVVLGDDGVAFVSSEGACIWSREIASRAKYHRSSMAGFTKVGKRLFYSTEDMEIVIADANCPFSYTQVSPVMYDHYDVLASERGDVVVLVYDNSLLDLNGNCTLHGFPVK